LSQHKYQKAARRQERLRRLWPALLSLVGFVVLTVAAYLAWYSSTRPRVEVEVAGSPRLVVDREEVDFGDVPLGQTVEVEFQIANSGDQTLLFEEDPYVEVVEGC
jgi:hypothetical protein